MLFASYASAPASTKGRLYKEIKTPYRNEFQRDKDRIIHSNAFRRLEYKTQVFVNHEGDHYRNRLTHSIEVASVARSLASALELSEDLAECVALAHDLGHTPFGHAGEDALDECMKDFGGFEHNLQSLRVVDELEEHYADFDGLNLSFECREGILKHCSYNNAILLGDVGERFINRQQPGLEAQLANFADELAYNNHDVEDGIRAGLISIEQLLAVPLFRGYHDEVQAKYPALAGRRFVYEILRRMINHLVSDLIDSSAARLGQSGVRSIAEVRSHSKALIGFSDTTLELNAALKTFLREQLYKHYKVKRMTAKARRVVRDLFDAFFNDPGLMPDEHEARTRLELVKGPAGRARAVADYIAGMTDRYAILEHSRLFEPSERT